MKRAVVTVVDEQGQPWLMDVLYICGMCNVLQLWL